MFRPDPDAVSRFDPNFGRKFSRPGIERLKPGGKRNLTREGWFMKFNAGDGRTVSAHRVGYPHTARRPANLKNFLPMARPLNLPRIPATYANGSWMPVYL